MLQEFLPVVALDLAAARVAIAALDAKLRPIANRKVDVTQPGWADRLKTKPKPLDEAGVRAEAEALLGSLVDAYAAGGDAERAAIRELLARHRAFTWATPLADPPTTAAGLRRQLLKLSAQNGGTDLRDAIVELDDLCARARQAGVDPAPLLAEAAALSDTAVIHRMSSVREQFLRARERYLKH